MVNKGFFQRNRSFLSHLTKRLPLFLSVFGPATITASHGSARAVVSASRRAPGCAPMTATPQNCVRGCM